MKKVLALVLSVMMVLSLSVVAFAATEEKATGTPGGISTPDSNDPDNTKPNGAIIGVGDKEGTDDEDPDKPGATYYYTIFRETAVAGDADITVTENGKNVYYEMLTDDEYAKHLSVSIRESGDKMIDSYAIVKRNGVYKIEVKTKTTYTTKKTTATWTMTLKRDKKYKVNEAEVEISQKWAEIIDDVTKSHQEIIFEDIDLADATTAPGWSYDDYTNDINIQALAVIPKDYKYAELYFDTDDIFWYTVKNSSKLTVNVYYHRDNKTMAQTYEDADLEMIFFDGTPEFDYTGTFHVTVDEDMFVYLIEGGKLVEGKFTWNKEAECWETNTRKLEGAVASDIKLDVSKYNATVNNNGTDNKDNPGTGSVDFVNVAVALGVVSLAAAGAVALKK